MGTEVSFTAKLVDQVSGAARQITKSLKGVDNALGQVNKGGGRQRDPLSGRFVEGSKEAESFSGTIKKLAGGVVAFKIAMGALDLGKQFVEGAVESVKFRDSTERGLGAILHSSAAARVLFLDTIKLSDQLGTNFQTTMTGVSNLLTSGFDVTGAKDLVKTMADLKALKPSVPIERLLLAIEQIKTAGVLQGDELRQLQEAGLGTDLIYKQLQKTLGKSVPEIKKLKEAGKLSADVTIDAIKAAVAQLTGMPLGKFAEEASMGFAGLSARLANLPTRAFTEFANNFDASGLTKDLQGIWKSIGPGSDVFTGAVEGITGIIQTAIPVVKAFFSGFAGPLSSLGEALQLTGGFFADAFTDPAFLSSVKSLGEGIGNVAVLVGVVAAGLVALVPPIVGVIAWFGELLGTVGSLAGDLIGGLVSGLVSGVHFVVKAVEDLGEAAIAAVKAVLSIHSPSGVMADLGLHTAIGMQQGIKAGTGGVVGASASMAGAAVRGAETGFASVGTGSAAATSNTSNNHFKIGVNVSAPSQDTDPETFGSGLARGMRNEFESMFASINPA